MNAFAIRATGTALAFGSLLMAGPASAIIHEQLPNSFDDDQVKPGPASVLLESDQTEVPGAFRGVSDEQGSGELNERSWTNVGFV